MPRTSAHDRSVTAHRRVARVSLSSRPLADDTLPSGHPDRGWLITRLNPSSPRCPIPTPPSRAGRIRSASCGLFAAVKIVLRGPASMQSRYGITGLSAIFECPRSGAAGRQWSPDVGCAWHLVDDLGRDVLLRAVGESPQLGDWNPTARQVAERPVLILEPPLRQPRPIGARRPFWRSVPALRCQTRKAPGWDRDTRFRNCLVLHSV